jgi:hypothetical protein
MVLLLQFKRIVGVAINGGTLFVCVYDFYGHANLILLMGREKRSGVVTLFCREGSIEEVCDIWYFIAFDYIRH